jgi:hypothetical protein
MIELGTSAGRHYNDVGRQSNFLIPLSVRIWACAKTGGLTPSPDSQSLSPLAISIGDRIPHEVDSSLCGIWSCA